MDSDRYDRQRRLREVGPEGQLCIERSEAIIPAGRSAAVELAYLVRAGVARVAINSARVRSLSHSKFFHFSGPRAVGEGAEGALRHLLTCLGRSVTA
jgi:molybdopterin/thiamine biosynthesis adenylyltransferase